MTPLASSAQPTRNSQQNRSNSGRTPPRSYRSASKLPDSGSKRMARRELNIWLAFADVTFVLFLCALMAAAASSRAVQDAKEKEQKATEDARRNATRAKTLAAANNSLASANKELSLKLADAEQ